MHVAIVHYSAPPAVGGVEILIRAHTKLLLAAGHTVTVLAGRGGTFDRRAPVKLVPLLDSKEQNILRVGAELAAGEVSERFWQLERAVGAELRPHLAGVDVCLAHNVLSMHKNLPLTSALWHMADSGATPPVIAICHDLAWTNPQYLPSLHEGEPWNLLKRPASGVCYATGSQERMQQFATLWGRSNPPVRLLPSGVDGPALLGLSRAGQRLARRLQLWGQDLVLLLPTRLARRKNIELAIRIVAGLVARSLKVRLIVTGPPGPYNGTNCAYVRELDDLRRALGVEKEVVLLHLDGDGGRPIDMSERVLADLYALSDALLFPSREEGFGLPVIEAGLARLPVFCSDILPLRALGCDSAHYFSLGASPHDVADMIEHWMHTDPSYRLRRRVLRSFTWQAVYARYLEPLLTQTRYHAEERTDTAFAIMPA